MADRAFVRSSATPDTTSSRRQALQPHGRGAGPSSILSTIPPMLLVPKLW